MTVSIDSKRGLFKLTLTIDDIPKTAQPILEISHGPFIDKINTLIKYSIENQDFEIISLVDKFISNTAKEKLKRIQIAKRLIK